MREADHARPCGTDAVLALPGVTRRYALQPGVTAPAIRQNEPTAAVDTGLRRLTPVDAGLRRTAFVQNEATAAHLGCRAIWKNEPVSAVTVGPDCR